MSINPLIKTTGARKPKEPKESADNNVQSSQNFPKSAGLTASASTATASNSSGNVKVVCRVRPLNKKEIDIGGPVCVEFLDEQTIKLNTSQGTETGPGTHKFVFDRVFNMNASQQEIYEFAAKPVVNSVLEGFNGTVFAYGQTSSGKTHTMQGPSIDDLQMRGIIPRMVNTVFDYISETPEHVEFTVKVSIVEIYLEKIRDLLSPEKTNLKVREDKARGIYLEDVTESYVSDEREVYDLMKLGASNRAISATNMNEGSSRSHSIFMMTIHQNNLHELSAKTGKLYLVDLAGSEKVGKTGAAGQTLEEAKNINKSLSALGNVINALTDSKSHQHIPYRDSKLTRILQESLGGNARTTLITTCSPSPFNDQETLSTLRFGYRAKSIKNTPKINREFTVAELKLLLDKAESTLELREKRIKILENMLQKNGIPLPKDGDIDSLGIQSLTREESAPATSTEATENNSESDNDEKETEKLLSRNLDNFNMMSRNDDQARIKLLESELEIERNNVRTQSEKVNLLRKEYVALNGQFITNEKENEAIITQLATLTLKLQEFEEQFKLRETEYNQLSALKDALIEENEELKKMDQLQTLKNILTEENKQAERSNENKGYRNEETEGVQDMANQMAKDFAAQFGITDEAALKAFTSSYLNKFKASIGVQSIRKGTEDNENELKGGDHEINEELIREREKNQKLQEDYQKLKKDYENIEKAKSVIVEQPVTQDKSPRKEDLHEQAAKAAKEKEQEEKERIKKQEEDKVLKRKSNNLEQNLDQLSNMYQQIASQKSQLKSDAQNPDKKVHRKTERILNLEKQLHETKDLVNQYKSKIESLKSLISMSSTASNPSSSEKSDNSEQVKQKKDLIRQEVMDNMMKDQRNLEDMQLRKNLNNTSFNTKIVKHIRGGQNKKSSIGTTRQYLNVLKQPNASASIPTTADNKMTNSYRGDDEKS